MFSDVQTKLVELLESKRASASVAAGRLIPAIVKPYEGELLRQTELQNLLPAVFIELDDGALEATTQSHSDWRGDLPFDLICAVLNEAGPGAAYSDGVALLTWTFEALAGAEITLSGGTPVVWDSFKFRRIVAGSKIWAYALTPNLTVHE